MSKKASAPKEQETDELGLVVHKYASLVLVVVPPSGFAETTLRYARSALFNVHVGTLCASTDDQAMIRGEFQDELQADELLSASTRMEPYVGLMLCGGPGALELAEHPEVLRLAREAVEQEKLVAAWGHSVAILARAGVVRRRRVTGDPSLRGLLEESGAHYTGHQLQVDGRFVTAYDDAAGFRFGKALVQLVRI